jgi:hypothetical protein
VHLVQHGAARQVEPKLATVVLNKSPRVVLAGLLLDAWEVDLEHVRLGSFFLVDAHIDEDGALLGGRSEV